MSGVRSLAFQVACRFPGRAPSGEEVRQAFPSLTRSRAFRYARDYRRAWVAEANRHRLPPVPLSAQLPPKVVRLMREHALSASEAAAWLEREGNR